MVWGVTVLNDVTLAVSAECFEFGALADIFDELVVNLLGRLVFQFLVIQQSAGGHLPKLHLAQPAVDHKITGSIPEMRVASLSARMVLQTCVEILVRKDEFPFFKVQPCCAVHVDLTLCHIDSRYADIVWNGSVCARVNDLETRGDPSEQRIVVDEPLRSLLHNSLPGVVYRAVASRIYDRTDGICKGKGKLRDIFVFLVLAIGQRLGWFDHIRRIVGGCPKVVSHAAEMTFDKIIVDLDLAGITSKPCQLHAFHKRSTEFDIG